MIKNYQPPYSITPTMLRLSSTISEAVGRLSVLEEEKNLRLRRANRIRTIQGSLAIEGNTLSEEQITAILEGKRIIAPPKEILEVRNAIKTYDQFETWQAASERDLLKAHSVLMAGLVDDAGSYRKGNVGVMNGNQVVHMAPPANRVKQLMGDLLGWLDGAEEHPLIASSIFHYEFEFIHPFSDGNGRMGRLWQTLILNQWNPLFANLPVESMIHEHQSEYYQAINLSTKKTDSSPFIEFMLQMILNTIESSNSLATPQVAPQVTPQVKELLSVIKGEMSRDELQTVLGLQDRKSFSERYLKPALTAGLIEMTIPEKPNSRLQKYRLANKALKR